MQRVIATRAGDATDAAADMPAMASSGPQGRKTLTALKPISRNQPMLFSTPYERSVALA